MTEQKRGSAVVALLLAAGLLLGSAVLVGSVLASDSSTLHQHHQQTVTSYDASQLGANAVVTVAVGSYYYHPQELTVTVGTTVVWVWEGGYHTVTSQAGAVESFNSGVIGAPGTYSHTFTIAGADPYFCEIHGVQLHSGNLYVVTGTLATETPTPQADFTPSPTPIATDTPTVTDTPITVVSPTPTNCPLPFTDLNGNVFLSAIQYLYCRGAVSGTSQTTYSPAGTATRGQFAKTVVLGFGIASYTPASPDFNDVPANYFAYAFIEAGYHAGILSGFDANTCQGAGVPAPCYLPNRPITRGQLTKLVVSAAGYAAFTPATPTFSDVGPSNVFYASIETAHHMGVINGYPDNTFRPNNNIRRDEMAQIVYKGVTTP